MAFYIKFENKEDLEWLQSILKNTVEKMKFGVPADSKLHGVQDKILRAHEAVTGFVTDKDLDKLGINVVKEEKEKAWEAKLCPTHPKYGAIKPPRTACEGCWGAYQKYHPLEYTTARKKWDAKNPAPTVAKPESAAKLKAAK